MTISKTKIKQKNEIKNVLRIKNKKTKRISSKNKKTIRKVDKS